MFKILFIFVLISHVALSEPIRNVKYAEEKVISLIDEYDTRPTVKILGGFVTVQRIGEEVSGRKMNEDVVDRMLRYVADHQLKIEVPLSERNGKSFPEESRSSKLKKIILPMLLLIKLKAAIIIPAVLSAIALVAFKGLGAGLIALALSGATAFKSLLEGHSSKKVSFEVMPPHWSRAGVAPSGPSSGIPASLIQEWPLHGYQTIS